MMEGRLQEGLYGRVKHNYIYTMGSVWSSHADSMV